MCKTFFFDSICLKLLTRKLVTEDEMTIGPRLTKLLKLSSRSVVYAAATDSKQEDCYGKLPKHILP